MTDLIDTNAVQRWLQQHQKAGFRAVLHLAGSEHWCKRQAELLISAGAFHQPVLLGWQNEMPGVAQCRKLLGSDQQCVAFNAYQGFNPNVLGICSGTLVAGGMLILLTPPLDEWEGFDDPDYQRLRVAGESSVFAGHFIRHVCGVLAGHSAVVYWQEGASVDWPELHLERDNAAVFTQQQRLVEQIMRVANGHARRPLVIEADRGRGKSAALGLAAAQLMLNGPVTILLTAANQRAVDAVFMHARQVLSAAGVETASESGELHTPTARLRFIAPDQLLKQRPEAQLLLVDEAAMIPVSLLTPMLEHYNRLVFATTVHGYEGNGRGFSLRFGRHLDNTMPQWRRVQLTQPIRWAEGDPLEALTAELLLLNAEPECLPTTEPVLDKLILRRLEAVDLLSDQALLTQIFGLLVIAHYQTTPDDLRLLLDHPEVMLDIARYDDVIVGVCLSMREGGFDPETCEQLQQQTRRLRGHLLPQSLFASGCDAALASCYQRIMRIAVHPAVQQRGIGRHLLGFVEKQCDTDFLGASFSAEPGVLAFWQAEGLQPVRLGSHKESATGEYACVVVKPLTPSARPVFNRMRSQLAEDIPYRLLTLNQDIQAALLPLLLKQLPSVIQDKDRKQALAYIHHRRGFETVQPALQRLLLALASEHVFQQADDGLLLEKLLLNRHWSPLAESYKLSGRKTIETQMRQRLQYWLEDS